MAYQAMLCFHLLKTKKETFGLEQVLAEYVNSIDQLNVLNHIQKKTDWQAM